MRLLVVGAGATGGYFGGRLAAAGRDVTFLVRPRRAAELDAKGLAIVSPHGDLVLKPDLVTAGRITGPYDVILLSVKAYALEPALDDLARAVGPQTMIVPVLNGMRHMDVIATRFGEQVLLGGVCRIAATIDPEGRIAQLAKFHELVYGERDGQPSERTAALHAFMSGAGFDAKLSPAITREMWEKWAFLATLGGITCLMRGSVGEIAAAAGGPDFVARFFDEVVTVVRAVGVAPSPEFLVHARGQVTAPGSPLTASMFRDLQAGGPIEADQILGDLVARARSVGLAVPLVSAAYTQLSVYQNRLSTG